jgi:hypothetical protein
MKTNFAMLLLAGTFATAAHASNVLPDSCGDPKMHFTIETRKSDGKVPPPSDGKARLVLEYPVVWTGLHLGTGGGDLRVGMDGTWLGAAGSNSFFTVEIDPGEHHLCVSEAGALGGVKKDGIAMATLKAEAGKTYFFQYKINFQAQNKSTLRTFTFGPVDEDDGRFQTKSLKVSEFTKGN